MIQAVLDDYKTAPISEKLRATFGFLAVLCKDPDAVAPEAERALAAGVSQAALRDAVWVCTCFSIFTRLADALGWELQDEKSLASSANMLWKKGYILF